MEAGGSHHLPHFHAYYGEEVVLVSLDPVEVIAGTMSRRQLRLVLAWAEIYVDALRDDWQLLQSGQAPLPVEPLR